MPGGSVATRYLTLAPKMQDGWKAKTERQLSSVDGGGIGKKIGGKLLAGFAALGVGQMIADTIGQALNSYADYEQLTGGVETLFKKSSDTVMQYAQDAYRTTGQSMNQYMEQLTGFSASLISSLDGDTAKAAEIGNMAMVDMSDNANKMGTSMESIQYAYQGFAKQNYTMLDNLKLGYGGTKEEMQRLLSDAEKLTGKKFDISNFSDIVEAIHAVQTEWDITGTTATEGSTTIEGAINQLSASWTNLLTGMGDESADMSALADTLFANLGNVVALVLPRLGQILLSLLGTVGKAIEDGINAAFAAVADFVVGWVSDVGASWGEYFTQLGDDVCGYLGETFGKAPERISNALSGAIGGIVEWGSSIKSKAASMASGFVSNIAGGIKSIPSKFLEILGKAKDKVAGFAGKLKTAGGNMIQGLIDGIGNAKQWVIDKINELCKNAEQAIKDFFGIKSPSRLMRKYGGYISQGLALGIGDGGSLVESAADKLSNRAAKAMSLGAASTALAAGGAGYGFGMGGITINLNYDAGADANQMVLDIASGLRRLNMTGGR